ncbi:DUF3558 family protein [Amycolatopsis benzoatilytica]|uniref:DUF3558 family protein n=1 Tax=Amycolatopsis benzoatilytica TaxID=346045 RepID=UPI00035F7E27|nr:DUF3558 family protein [Amycolatopsis benzoatilytica]
MGFKGTAAAFGAAALLLAGCTTQVSGSASPVPGQGPVTPVVDACALLDAQQLAALGYQAQGKPEKASKERRTPATCRWTGTDPDHSTMLIVGWSVDQSLDEYLQGALKKADPVSLGGLQWTRYAGFMGGSCDLYTTFSEKSFAFVSVANDDDAKACQTAKQVTPQVAAKLPGGQPAPPLAPPSTTPSDAPPSGPLASVNPCTLLKPEQAQQLKMEPQGQLDHSSVIAAASYCLWKDTDGDAGQKPFEVWVGPGVPITQWAGMNVAPTEQIDNGGRKWSLFPKLGGLDAICAAAVTVAGTSSVRIVSGNLDDPAKACDAIRAGIPLVSGNLPA